MFALTVFLALGVWQVERRASKLALIAAVTERVNAPAQPSPSSAEWARLNAARDAYRHGAIEGQLLHDRETLVQALTEDGAGYWVLTPLLRENGTVVLINRGFVPAARAERASRRAGLSPAKVRITGLLRMSEPGGSLLRSNQPAQERWFSRDVKEIAHARGMTRVAPYFIDADATVNAGGWPRGGMTVVTFPNNHLVYSITWFALAALAFGGLIVTLRQQAREKALDEPVIHRADR